MAELAATPAPRLRVQAMKEYHPPLGCEGRVRITIGTREQMRQAAEALHTTMLALSSVEETA